MMVLIDGTTSGEAILNINDTMIEIFKEDNEEEDRNDFFNRHCNSP